MLTLYHTLSLLTSRNLAGDFRQALEIGGIIRQIMTSRQGHLIGDATEDQLRFGFEGRLNLQFLRSQLTTDDGLLADRELDETLELIEAGADVLADSRQGSHRQLPERAAFPTGPPRNSRQKQAIAGNFRRGALHWPQSPLS